MPPPFVATPFQNAGFTHLAVILSHDIYAHPERIQMAT